VPARKCYIFGDFDASLGKEKLLIDNYPGFGYIDTSLIENKQIENVRM
jgi:hypothetical protein